MGFSWHAVQRRGVAWRGTHSVEHGGYLEVVLVVVRHDDERWRRDVPERAHARERHHGHAREGQHRGRVEPRVLVQRLPDAAERVDAAEAEEGGVHPRQDVVQQAVLVRVKAPLQRMLNLRGQVIIGP